MAHSWKRSRSLSPRNSHAHEYHSSDDALRPMRLQVLQDVLRHTSLAEMRDREIVEWLVDANKWLNGSDVAGGGNGTAEIRFLLLGVLHTLPWWRVVETVNLTHAKTYGAGFSQAPSAEAARAITRWHEKMQISFERVCLTLIEQSQHTVSGVLEVAMKPFHLRPPVRDSAERVIPCDTIIRLINAIAAKYSPTYVLDLLPHCVSSLMPRRRWANRRHHLACAAIFLHLALEGHVPEHHPQGRRNQSNIATREILRDPQARDERPARGEATSSGTCTADVTRRSDGGTRCCAVIGGEGLRPAPLHQPAVSASDVDFSDASLSHRKYHTSSDADLLIAGGSRRYAEMEPQNNKMLTYRNELIRFVLHRLLELELTLERNEAVAAFEDAVRSPPSISCRSGAMPFSPSSFPSSPFPDTAGGGITSADSAVDRQFSDGAQPYIRILKDCTMFVFRKLADDLSRQQAAGVCGNADWWRELLSFHLGTILCVERPVCLFYLAPSLALLGTEEESIDMVHKVISLVTKGTRPVQPQKLPGPTTAGPLRRRMAPPSVGVQSVPMAQRIRAAMQLYPLFKFLKDRLGNGEGARKRILKSIAQEMKGAPAGARPSRLVEVLFAQCAAISELLGVDMVPSVSSTGTPLQLPQDTPTPHDWIAEALRPLLVKYALHEVDGSGSSPGACALRLDLLQMERDGLLHPALMDACPWNNMCVSNRYE